MKSAFADACVIVVVLLVWGAAAHWLLLHFVSIPFLRLEALL